MEKQKTVKPVNFLFLGFYALSGLFIEWLLSLLEPFLFGGFTKTTQQCLHLIIACILWGVVSFFLIYRAKIKYLFNMFALRGKIDGKYLAVCIFLLFAVFLISTRLEGGIKPLLDFRNLDTVTFIFQQIYQLLKALMVLLVIIFGQHFGELYFEREDIPWGGFLLAFTWGWAHLSVQSNAEGFFAMMLSIVYGVVYMYFKKDLRYVGPIIAIMFIL